MKELIKNFNIHDRVKFRIISSERDNIQYTYFLPDDYCYYETEYIDKPDFIVRIGSFIPENSDCVILDNKFFIKNNYLYCWEKYKSAKWSFEVSGLDTDQMTAKISYNLPGSLLIADFVINFLINLILTRKGVSIIHGSAILKSGEVSVFSAQGGSGKTSTAINAIGNNYQFLGDDSILIHESVVYNYIRPLNIFSFNYLPLVRNNMPIKKQMELHFKSLLQYVKITLVTKVDPRQLFPKSIGNSGQLKNLFVLIPTAEWSNESIAKTKAVKFILNNQKLDSIPYVKYIEMYGYLYPDSKIALYWTEFTRNLELNLPENGVRFYRSFLPFNYTTEVFNNLIGVIENEH